MATAYAMPTGGMNINPTGAKGGSTTAGGAPVFSTGGPGNYGYGNMSPQPIATHAIGVSMNPGTGGPVAETGMNNQTTATQNPFDLTGRQQNRALQETQQYFGEGVGAELQNYINQGAGYNSALTQQAIDAQNNAMQQQIQLGANDLNSQLGAMGISSGSSALPEALTSYYNQAAQSQNAIDAQEYYNMWNQSQGRLADMLQYVGNVNAIGTANQSTPMDYLNQALGIGQSVAGLFGL